MIEYLYEDEYIIVCVKPAGLATETKDIRSTDLVSQVRTHLVRQERKAGIRRAEPPYLALIHRLDQPVEGIIVLGKNKKAAAKLSESLRAGDFDKRYRAVLSRMPDESVPHLKKSVSDDGWTFIEDEITIIGEGNARIVTGLDKKEAPGERRIARMEYKVLSPVENPEGTGQNKKITKDQLNAVTDLSQTAVMADIHLLTGRFHQIRATMAYMCSPIAGDVRYGGPEIAERNIIKLSSCYLSFSHPISGKRMEFRITPLLFTGLQPANSNE
jgi:23S rRNA pseudouridine1911/1915/1917 synthase